MTRRVPVLATFVVVAAIAVMIGLGIWQVQRAAWKEGLLATYAQADRLPPVAWPIAAGLNKQPPLFRRASGYCADPSGREARAGQNRSGEAGYVFFVDCAGSGGGRVELGWSRNPRAAFDWSGGAVAGTVAPDSKRGSRLVLDTPPAGLEASARPSLSAISSNHRFYAIQWFAFAGIALVVYLLALRGRWRQR